MGPRLLGRGDLNFEFPPAPQFKIPSMGPRLLGRGDFQAGPERAGHIEPPSMGPRLLGRGDQDFDQRPKFWEDAFNGAAAVRPRRSANSRRVTSRSNGLQWGRGC